ncbi:Protein RKD3 [Platanthera guangdongensis]|uniref:Protein RKD3 n=1 Tax=Platanthera guangdongensis TaxID=2320717 RepID=A0ABR2LVB3_9ASPA
MIFNKEEQAARSSASAIALARRLREIHSVGDGTEEAEDCSTGVGVFRSQHHRLGEIAMRVSAVQLRERTGKLHIKDLSDYFHLPISKAAKELRICSTALKKICRKHGIPRWPHRKIKSIDGRISNLLRDFCGR